MKDMRFSKRIVIFCILIIMIYTGLQLYFSYRLAIEISPTLTTCVYAFFGTELAATAFIKIFEKDNNNSNDGGGMSNE